MTKCQKCGNERINIKSAIFKGKYYSAICSSCLTSDIDDISSNSAGYERRRGYEDYAQDTVQPYDSTGKPRKEFARLYPKAASKMFDKQTLDELKRQI